MNGSSYAEWEELFPGMQGIKIKCPACQPEEFIPEWSHSEFPLKTQIMHLNDFHLWSRFDIADWLDSLELDLQISENATFKLTRFERAMIKFADSSPIVNVLAGAAISALIIMIYRLLHG